jgi:hypothetical protein
MAFGQARQEDMIEYLQRRIPKEAISKVASELRIDLSPPKSPPIEASSDEVERIEWRAEELSSEDGWERLEPIGNRTLSIEAAVDLLNEYSARVLANERGEALERYRELLDAYSTCLRRNSGL